MDLIYHLKGVANKTTHRGFKYVGELFRWYLRRNLYRFKLAAVAGRRPNRPAWDNDFAPIAGERSDEVLLDYFMERKTPSFHFEKDRIKRVVEGVPSDLKETTISEANKVLERRFNFRNIGEHRFGREIDWSYGHKNSISWLWDLNRHRYFLDLGLAFYYTDQNKYLDQLIELWGNWIVSNPGADNGSSSTPFEVASRLNNWIWAFFLVVYSNRRPAPPLGKFLQSMADHAEYLYYHLEYHWPNNHLFLESKTLFEFSLLFPEVKGQGKYLQRSAKVFREQVASQILPDGGHSELSSMYHRIVAGELIEIVALMRRNGSPEAVAFHRKLQTALNFSSALIRPDGSTSLLGDSANTDNNIRFGNARVGLNDLNYWLAQEVESDRLPPMAKKRGLSVEVFPNSGYAFIRNESVERSFSSTFDFGAFSRNPASDHAHNDALSFDLVARGREIIVDPGVCFAKEPTAIPQDYFRRTRAHNTLLIDEREQSQIWRESDVRNTAKTELLNLKATGEIIEIEASCVPYWAARRTLIHTRKIRFLAAGQLEIHDEVCGAGRRRLQWFFHFSPDLLMVTDADGGVSGLDAKGDPIIRILVEAVKMPALSIVKGQRNPPLGWRSLDSASLQATYTTIYDLSVELPFQCNFELRF